MLKTANFKKCSYLKIVIYIDETEFYTELSINHVKNKIENNEFTTNIIALRC